LPGTLGGHTTPSGEIHLYEEGLPSGGSAYYKALDIGGLNFSSSIQLRIEYYPNSGGSDCPGIQGVSGMGQWSGACWKSYYNGSLEAQWNSGGTGYNSYAANGGGAVAGETEQNNNDPLGDVSVELPTTIYGSSSPSSADGLQLKGANGYVVWNNSLSSDYTAEYDERNCPTSGPGTACPRSSAFYVSNFYNYYKLETYSG
jgi:hypothetical protein